MFEGFCRSKQDKENEPNLMSGACLVTELRVVLCMRKSAKQSITPFSHGNFSVTFCLGLLISRSKIFPPQIGQDEENGFYSIKIGCLVKEVQLFFVWEISPNKLIEPFSHAIFSLSNKHAFSQKLYVFCWDHPLSSELSS
jgi:hypothetical protein